MSDMFVNACLYIAATAATLIVVIMAAMVAMLFIEGLRK